MIVEMELMGMVESKDVPFTFRWLDVGGDYEPVGRYRMWITDLIGGRMRRFWIPHYLTPILLEAVPDWSPLLMWFQGLLQREILNARLAQIPIDHFDPYYNGLAILLQHYSFDEVQRMIQDPRQWIVNKVKEKHER